MTIPLINPPQKYIPELLIPAYFDPTTHASLWTQIGQAAASGYRVVAIANPNSGPGTAQQAQYTNAIANVKRNGGKAFGYVHTGYMTGTPTMAAIEADIDSWFNWYPAIDGIFLDEMAYDNVPAHVTGYQTLTAYIKAKNTNKNLRVTGNPGTGTIEMYVGSVDQIVIYENTSAQFKNYAFSNFVQKYPKKGFAMLLYASPLASVQGILPRMLEENIDSFFAQSNSSGSAWTTLGTYFPQLLAMLKK